jgi:hypothetical protein
LQAPNLAGCLIKQLLGLPSQDALEYQAVPANQLTNVNYALSKHMAQHSPKTDTEYPIQAAENTDAGGYLGALPAFGIMIYPDPEESGNVHGTVQAGYQREGVFAYQILQLVGDQEVRYLDGGLGLSREAGAQAARRLIAHFRSLRIV